MYLNNLIANQGKAFHIRYLIDAKWWREWTNYVNFDFSKNKLESFINNDDLYSKRPGQIKNINLIQDLKSNELKANLIETHDFQALTQNIYKQLKKWYTIDHEIVRFLKEDPLTNELYVDLYTEKSAKTGLYLRPNKNYNYDSIQNSSDKFGNYQSNIY